MSSTYMTPRGLIINLSNRDGTDVILVSNDDIQTLYDEFVNKSGDSNPPPTIINDTIELVSRVFVGKSYTILNNVSQAGKVSDFMEDTKQFINGGTRKLAIHTWDMYIGTASVDEVSTQLRNPYCKTTSLLLTSKDVTKWIQREGGIFDMLCVMHILFN